MILPDQLAFSHFIVHRIMRFVIPVVFCEITNVECMYWPNTTVFIGRI